MHDSQEKMFRGSVFFSHSVALPANKEVGPYVEKKSLRGHYGREESFI